MMNSRSFLNLIAVVLALICCTSVCLAEDEQQSDVFDQLEEFLQKHKVDPNQSAEQLYDETHKLLMESSANNWVVLAAIELIAKLRHSSSHLEVCQFSRLALANTAAGYIETGSAVRRRVNKMLGYFGRKLMQKCDRFLEEAKREFETEFHAVNKLTREELDEFMTKRADGSYALASDSHLPAIIRSMTRVKEEKCTSIGCLNIKSKAKSERFNSSVLSRLQGDCFTFKHRGPAQLLRVTQAVAVFTPELYDQWLDMPKIFDGNRRAFDELRMREEICLRLRTIATRDLLTVIQKEGKSGWYDKKSFA